MPIYIQHDFYSNFSNSISYGDTDTAFDILKSEISELMVYKFEDVIDLFKKADIKINANKSDEDILHQVVEQIKTNPKFNRGLAFLIIKSNAEDGAVKNIADTSKKLAVQLSKLGQEFIDNPRDQMMFENDTLDMIQLKADKKGDRDRTIVNKDNTFLWLVGIIAVGFAGYYIYKYFQNKKDAELRRLSLEPKLKTDGMADGGLLGESTVAASNGTLLANGAIAGGGTALGANGVQAPPPIDKRIYDPAFNVPPDVLIPHAPQPLQGVPQTMPQGTLQGTPQLGQPVSNVSQQQAVAGSMANLNFNQQQIQANGLPNVAVQQPLTAVQPR